MRHPFRKLEPTFRSRGRCRAIKLKRPPLPLGGGGTDVCCVQSSRGTDSSRIALASLALYLVALGLSVVLVLPDSNPCEGVARRYRTAEELFFVISEEEPKCIILSSHDARFGSLRRDPRTLRWAHEVPACFDPQASRCSTPLYGTNESVMKNLRGYAGLARPFRSWDFLADFQCTYTPGPLRVIGAGTISDCRAGFKAFETLAAKNLDIHFLWYGAPLAKRWANIQFYSSTDAFEDALNTADILVWCARIDGCPLELFSALYLGVHVWVSDKYFTLDVPSLKSDVDGTHLLLQFTGPPQQAPLHLAQKNTKQPRDVQKARTFVQDMVTEAPDNFIEHILANARHTPAVMCGAHEAKVYSASGGS